MATTSKERNAIKNRALNELLFEVHARGIGEFDGPSGSALKMYSVNGHIIIVQEFAGDMGYEVYASIDRTNSVTATHSAIRELAGL